MLETIEMFTENHPLLTIFIIEIIIILALPFYIWQEAFSNNNELTEFEKEGMVLSAFFMTCVMGVVDLFWFVQF